MATSTVRFSCPATSRHGRPAGVRRRCLSGPPAITVASGRVPRAETHNPRRLRRHDLHTRSMRPSSPIHILTYRQQTDPADPEAPPAIRQESPDAKRAVPGLRLRRVCIPTRTRMWPIHSPVPMGGFRSRRTRFVRPQPYPDGRCVSRRGTFLLVSSAGPGRARASTGAVAGSSTARSHLVWPRRGPVTRAKP
jgi:hypothetical protein